MNELGWDGMSFRTGRHSEQAWIARYMVLMEKDAKSVF